MAGVLRKSKLVHRMRNCQRLLIVRVLYMHTLLADAHSLFHRLNGMAGVIKLVQSNGALKECRNVKTDIV